MKYILYKYDSKYERVTIRADDIVVETLSEIKIENAAVTIQTATAVYKNNFNVKKTRNMRTKINRLNEIDLNDTHFMNDIAIIVVNDIDEILEFKEKAPLIANEFCISYREYNYEVDYMILIHKTVLAPIFANCCDLSNIAYDASLIYLPTPRFYTINDAIINYVNVDREDECQFYTVDNWEYDNHIGFYPKPLFTNIKNN